MRIIRLGFVLAALLSAQTVFADDDMMFDKSCAAIAKACSDAGFARKDSDKKFWKGCMRPLLLNKSVKGVTIDGDIVKSCRTSKIEKLKIELKELEKASSK